METTIKTYFKDILSHYYERLFFIKLQNSFFLTLSLNLIYGTILILLEQVWYLSPTVKMCILWGFSLNIIFIFHLIKAAFFSFHTQDARDRSVFLNCGSQQPKVGDSLLIHYELSQRDDEFSLFAVQKFMDTWPRTLFYPDDVQQIPKKRSAAALLFLILFFICIFSFGSAVNRLLDPKTPYLPDYPYSLSFSMADTCIYAGDSLSFDLVKNAPAHFPIYLFSVDDPSAAPILYSTQMDSSASYSFSSFSHTRNFIAALKRPTPFYPRRFLIQDTLRISVVQRPRLTDLNISVNFPEYTALKDQHYSANVNQISCLPGSRLQIRAVLSQEAGKSFLHYNEETIRFHHAGHELISILYPDSTGNIHLDMRNRDSVRTEEIPRFRLFMEKDAYPQITVLQPEKRSTDLTSDLQLSLQIEIKDDYGLEQLSVFYRIVSPYKDDADSSFLSFDILHDRSLRYEQLTYLWEIPAGLSPGSTVKFYCQIADNDNISGPKTSRTALYSATLPSLGDMFKNLGQQQSRQAKDMKTLQKQAQQQAETLQNIQNNMLQSENLSWEERSALENTVNKMQNMQDPIKELQQQLNEQLKAMTENKLFSEETMAAYEKLSQLTDELFDKEMMDLLKKIQEKLKQDKPKDLDKLVKKLDQQEESFRKNLDRLTEIFKRIQQAQRLEELNQLMKDILQKQTDLLEKSDQRSATDLKQGESKLARDTKDLQTLSKETETLFKEDQQEMLAELNREMDDMAPAADMQNAAQSFQNMQREAGKKSAESAQQKMQTLSEKMTQMSQDIMSQQRSDVSNTMRHIFQKCMIVSVKQEDLNALISDLPAGSPLFGDIMVSQGHILTLAQDIYTNLDDLSQKTFLIDKAVGTEAGSILAHISKSLKDLEDTRWSNGKKEMTRAHISMNRLGRFLLQRLQQANSDAGNASGMENYLQQLQQMAGQQGAINQGMPQAGSSLKPGNSGMDGLSRMAAQQQTLRRALKALQQQLNDAGQGKRMTGDLDRIAKDMDDVISDLRRKKITARTKMKQNSIQQRLLDASRSAKSKDFKQKRSSKTADFLQRISPDGLPRDLGERQSLIRQILKQVEASDLSPKEKQEMEKYLHSLQLETQP